jgi:hypothetical protein
MKVRLRGSSLETILMVSNMLVVVVVVVVGVVAISKGS